MDENSQNGHCVCTVVCIKVHKIVSVWCKIALGEVGVSLPWWCHALVLLAPSYWRLFLNSKNVFIMEKWPDLVTFKSSMSFFWNHFYESNGVCLVVLQCTDHYTGALMNGFCTHNRNHQKENNPSSSCCWPKRNNRYHASSFKPPTALMMMTILGAFINCITNIG